MAIPTWTNTRLARTHGAVCSATWLTEACIPSHATLISHVFIEAS
jgi:hypothetical protein